MSLQVRKSVRQAFLAMKKVCRRVFKKDKGVLHGPWTAQELAMEMHNAGRWLERVLLFDRYCQGPRKRFFHPDPFFWYGGIGLTELFHHYESVVTRYEGICLDVLFYEEPVKIVVAAVAAGHVVEPYVFKELFLDVLFSMDEEENTRYDEFCLDVLFINEEPIQVVLVAAGHVVVESTVYEELFLDVLFAMDEESECAAVNVAVVHVSSALESQCQSIVSLKSEEKQQLVACPSPIINDVVLRASMDIDEMINDNELFKGESQKMMNIMTVEQSNDFKVNLVQMGQEMQFFMNVIGVILIIEFGQAMCHKSNVASF